MHEERENAENPERTWIRRLGIVGFLFFLIKGLLWLIAPALVAYFAFG